MSKQTRFSDLDLDFLAHPGTGDVSRKINADAVKRALRNLVYTHFYDRPFRSNIGSSVTKLLFEPINPITAIMIEQAIQEVIINFEPRVSLTNISVDVRPDENGYNATLVYYIVGQPDPVVTSMLLHQIR